MLGEQGCPSLLSIGGITCNFTPILRYFQLMGDEPRPQFFLGEQINCRPKTKLFTKRKKICSPNCSGDLRSNAHQSQIIGGMQMQTLLKLLGGHSQIIGGDIYPHPPLGGFDNPVGEKMKQRQTNVKETDLWKTIIRVEAQHKA